MSSTPSPLGEPVSSRGDSAVRWFEPTAAADSVGPAPALFDFESDLWPDVPMVNPTRRDAVRWKEPDWVGFADRAGPEPAAIRVVPGADRAVREAEPPDAVETRERVTSSDAGEKSAAPSAKQPPDAFRPVSAPQRRRQRIAHVHRVIYSRGARIAAGGIAVMVLAASAYYGGERLAGFAGAAPSVTVMARPAPAQEAPIPHPPATSAAAVAPHAPAPDIQLSPRAARYIDLAKTGEPAAEYDLAVLYVRGDGVAQNLSAAAAWFRKAAQAGISAAAFNLGVMYERGLGVSRDLDEAISWYRRAASRNYPPAQYNLAIAYAEGRGAPQDLIAAARWYHDAAMQGLAAAMMNIAILYEKGEGVARSLPDAYAWYRAAARRGNTDATRRARELFDQLNVNDKGSALMRASAVADELHETSGEPPPSSANMDGFDPRPAMAPGGWLGGSDGARQPAG